jgi:small subunit ribosomal protein S21
MSPIRTGGEVMSLAEVRLQEGESIENALRRFKRKVQAEEIIKDVKRHSFYLKPGAKRRAKQALARRRVLKKMCRESRPKHDLLQRKCRWCRRSKALTAPKAGSRLNSGKIAM